MYPLFLFFFISIKTLHKNAMAQHKKERKVIVRLLDISPLESCTIAKKKFFINPNLNRINYIILCW